MSGVLLDRARFAQVGEHRLVGGAALRSAGELGKGDDRDVELLGHDLEVSGDLRDLLHAVFAAPPGGHQLEVVDDDEVDLFEPAQLRLHLPHRDARRVVEVDVRLGEHLRRHRDAHPVVPRELARCAAAAPRPTPATKAGRCASCSLLISREKTATVRPPLVATFSAMLSAREVLPMPGRAAIRMRSVLLSPVITRSSAG